MEEVIELIKKDQLKLKKRRNKRKNAKEEDFNDIDEFDEDEEENYMHAILEKRKLEDENLEVYLIEAEEVKDVDRETEEGIIRDEMGNESDEEDENLLHHHFIEK